MPLRGSQVDVRPADVPYIGWRAAPKYTLHPMAAAAALCMYKR